MAFKNIKIVGDGTAQVVLTNTTTLEGVTHGVIAYNSTENVLSFDILIEGDIRVTEEVPANGSYRLPDKINVPVNETLAINAPVGVNITVSSYQSAIDVTAANTVVQQAVVDTIANVALTNADVAITQADVISTNADVITAQNIIDNISVAPLWVSGADYQAYQVVTDPTDFMTYKAKAVITGLVTEPHLDTTNWQDISTVRQVALDLKANQTETFTKDEVNALIASINPVPTQAQIMAYIN
jgi:hypothetical protein